MFYLNIKTGEIIDWKVMEFGDSKNSYCGICNKPEDGYWKNDHLIEDIICENCRNVWIFVSDDESE